MLAAAFGRLPSRAEMATAAGPGTGSSTGAGTGEDPEAQSLTGTGKGFDDFIAGAGDLASWSGLLSGPQRASKAEGPLPGPAASDNSDLIRSVQARAKDALAPLLHNFRRSRGATGPAAASRDRAAQAEEVRQGSQGEEGIEGAPRHVGPCDLGLGLPVDRAVKAPEAQGQPGQHRSPGEGGKVGQEQDGVLKIEGGLGFSSVFQSSLAGDASVVCPAVADSDLFARARQVTRLAARDSLAPGGGGFAGAESRNSDSIGTSAHNRASAPATRPLGAVPSGAAGSSATSTEPGSSLAEEAPRAHSENEASSAGVQDEPCTLVFGARAFQGSEQGQGQGYVFHISAGGGAPQGVYPGGAPAPAVSQEVSFNVNHHSDGGAVSSSMQGGSTCEGAPLGDRDSSFSLSTRSAPSAPPSPSCNWVAPTHGPQAAHHPLQIAPVVHQGLQLPGQQPYASPGPRQPQGHRQSAFQPVAQAASAGDLVLGHPQGTPAMVGQGFPGSRNLAASRSADGNYLTPLSLPPTAGSTLQPSEDGAWGPMGAGAPLPAQGTQAPWGRSETAARPSFLEERLKVLTAGLQKSKVETGQPTGGAVLGQTGPVSAGPSSEEGAAGAVAGSQGPGGISMLVSGMGDVSSGLGVPASPGPLAGAAPGCANQLIGRKRGWAAKCAKDPLKYFDDQFCKGCKRLRRTSPEIRTMLLQLSAEAKERSASGHGDGSPLEQLLPGRCSCGQASSRKETAADTAVLLQLVRTEGSQAGVYEPKLDGSTWRKYGDKSGQPGSQGDASRGRPGAGCSVSSLAQGRLYYKCTKCSKPAQGDQQAEACSRAAKKMVQPIHGAPGLFLLRYEGAHSHPLEGLPPQHPLSPEQQVARHTGAGVLWEVDLSHIGGEECGAVVESLEEGLVQRCREVALGELEGEIVPYLRAVLAGVPALRKHMLSKVGQGHDQ